MADCSPSTNRFFSPVQTHIKMYNSTFVAVEGANMTHKMSSLPSIRFPYQQVLTGRITLRAGQTNYLLNHLGLGDNATFLAITAQYDSSSKFEADNYIQYSYYSDKGRLMPFSHMLVLTGNSENRIEQLYLHNPNQNAAVVLEVMVGVIDETYDFFTQNEESTSGNNSTTINNLVHTDLSLWDADSDIMVVTNSFNQPILYLNLNDINSVSQDGKIVTVDEASTGQILLVFKTEYDATQARGKITQWIDDYNNNSTPPVDDFEPIIRFTTNVTDDDPDVIPYGIFYSIDGDRAFVGDSTLSLADYSNTITKTILSNYLISEVRDFEDTIVSVSPASDLTIRDVNGAVLTSIVAAGEYYIYFDIADAIGNKVDPAVNVKINVVA